MTWTKAETKRYSRRMDKAQLDAVALGKKLSETLSKKIKAVTKKPGREPFIDPIFAPLVLEQMISALDYSYDNLGNSNFLWVIDLYVGRKCARIIPLLVEIADRLTKGGHTSRDNAADGGGADGYIWCVVASKTYISMQWDTQSRSYYISLDRRYSEGPWKLYVSEYELRQTPQKAEHSWEKEPGFVLEYEGHWSTIDEPKFQIDDHRVENAWLRLPQINRFFDMVNPTCTALDINLYKPPFNDKPARDDD